MPFSNWFEPEHNSWVDSQKGVAYHYTPSTSTLGAMTPTTPTHEAQLRSLKRAMRLNSPLPYIVMDENGNIIDGHHRRHLLFHEHGPDHQVPVLIRRSTPLHQVPRATGPYAAST